MHRSAVILDASLGCCLTTSVRPKQQRGANGYTANSGWGEDDTSKSILLEVGAVFFTSLRSAACALLP
jgi:hypothetical protein